MDDALKLKIAASLDTPTDGVADADVVRAIETDPAARDYARSLHTLERALRQWPARSRDDASWEKLAARIEQHLDEVGAEKAKVRRGRKVSHEEPDPATPPVFEEESPQRSESSKPMSETQDQDDDLENLAALARTSTVPSTPVAAVRASLAAITDQVDDTSSGVVDIKKLAAIAKSAPPPAAAASVADARNANDTSRVIEEKPEDKKTSSSKNNDVMVTPAKAATPAPIGETPRKSGGAMWGAIGGMALMAGVFALYNSTRRSEAPQEASSVQSPASNEGSNTTMSESTRAQPPAEQAPSVAVAPPPPAAAPAPAEAPVVASPAPTVPVVVAAAPTPSAAPPQEAPAPDPAAARRTVVAAAATAEREAAAHRENARNEAQARATTAARAAATREPPAGPAPATTAAARTTPTAPAVVAAATTPAGARGGSAAAAGGATTGAATARSVDDLMNRVAGASAAAQPAAPAPEAALPERPTRAQVTSVLSALSGAVRSCANGQTGTAPVAIVIANDGTVRSASVSGQFAGTPAGECIAGVVRRARFQRFSQPQASLTYPFVILPPRN